jgi:dCTP deaminase
MILCDRDLKTLLRAGFLLDPFDESAVNPASVDIRVGLNVIRELGINYWGDVYIGDTSREAPLAIVPGEFILVETLEKIKVPNGYAVDCKLKSTMARKGLNHSLAFWFDPGWIGVGTFELHNVTRFNNICIWYGMRIAQIVVHRLSGDAEHPYQGRYQNAKRVELAKPER